MVQIFIFFSAEKNKKTSSHLIESTPPVACIIKLIAVVTYGFRNKLLCLSLASLSSLVY
jgi:hypothetical protein